LPQNIDLEAIPTFGGINLYGDFLVDNYYEDVNFSYYFGSYNQIYPGYFDCVTYDNDYMTGHRVFTNEYIMFSQTDGKFCEIALDTYYGIKFNVYDETKNYSFDYSLYNTHEEADSDTNLFENSHYKIINDRRIYQKILGDSIPIDSGSGSSAPTPLQLGNTWFVSPNGNDSTFLKGRIDKPAQSISAAVNIATSGDTIIVYPGTYNINSNLFKNGLNYYFYPGAIVNSSNSIFNLQSNQTCKVFGKGVFNTTVNYLSLVMAVSGINNSTFYMEFDEIFSNGFQSIVIYTESNVVNVDITLIGRFIRNGNDSVYGFSPRGNVNLYVDIERMETTSSQIYGSCLWLPGSFTGDVKIIARDGIYGSPNTTQTVIYADASGVGYFEIIGNIIHRSTSGYAVRALSETFNLTINGDITTTSMGIALLSHSICRINGRIFGGQTFPAIEIYSGKLFLNGEVKCGGSVSAIKKLGGDLILETVKIITNGGFCIDSSNQQGNAPQEIKILHSVVSNNDKSASVVNIISGTSLIVDSDVE
jgi:hypothetical protein